MDDFKLSKMGNIKYMFVCKSYYSISNDKYLMFYTSILIDVIILANIASFVCRKGLDNIRPIDQFCDFLGIDL